jgi:hypothetical protein
MGTAALSNEERDMGVQPIGQVLEELGLKAHDLVAASTEQLTHKMVSRAVKGRRLTQNTKGKVIRALTAAAGRSFDEERLFTY